jgi:hypothetical protein
VCDICRDQSRHVATSRGRSHLLNVSDVLIDRCWRDKVLSPKVVSTRRQSRWPLAQYRWMLRGVRGRPARAFRSNASSIESINSVSGLVATCRDGSSIMHLMIPRLVPRLAGYPQSEAANRNCQRKRGRMGGSEAETIRQPRDRFNGAAVGAFSNCGCTVNPL